MKKTTICSMCKINQKTNTSYCHDCQKIYSKKYRENNREKIKNKNDRYTTNPKYKIQRTIYLKKYVKDNKEKRQLYAKQYNLNIRTKVLNNYGNKCKCCGEDQPEFLAIDHINGGGRKHRKDISRNIYNWIIDNNFPDDLQILCHNCNSAKHYYGICPHMKQIMPSELVKADIEK